MTYIRGRAHKKNKQAKQNFKNFFFIKMGARICKMFQTNIFQWIRLLKIDNRVAFWIFSQDF